MKRGLLYGLPLGAIASVGLTATYAFMLHGPPTLFLGTVAMLAVIWFTILLIVSFRVAQQTMSAQQGAFTGQIAGFIGIVVSTPISLLAIILVVPIRVGIPSGLLWAAGVLPILGAMGMFLGAIGILIGTFLGRARAEKQSLSSPNLPSDDQHQGRARAEKQSLSSPNLPSDDQHQYSLNTQRKPGGNIAAYLLGLLCGSVPLLFFVLALFSRPPESQAAAFGMGMILQFLAALLMLPLALLKGTRPIASGLFIPLLLTVCLEIFTGFFFFFQPIIPCSAVLLILTTMILFVSWVRK